MRAGRHRSALVAGRREPNRVLGGGSKTADRRKDAPACRKAQYPCARSRAAAGCRKYIRQVKKMKVNGVHPAVPPPAVESTRAVVPEEGGGQWMATNDVVEISEAAKLAVQVHNIPEIRTDLVARVKAKIEAGTYETEERLQITVEKLMEELLP